MTEGLVSGNYFDKYATANPVYRRLVGRFVRCARQLIDLARPAEVIEVGCGPGELAGRLFALDRGWAAGPVQYIGIDVSAEQVSIARQRWPHLRFEVASAYGLPFADRSADLVMACEVLEHLDDPALAVAELARVSRKWVLISVPWEPVWRMLNVARGRYLARVGNTPGHVRHFSRAAVHRLVGAQLQIVAERRPLPWTMLLAARRR